MRIGKTISDGSKKNMKIKWDNEIEDSRWGEELIKPLSSDIRWCPMMRRSQPSMDVLCFESQE